MPTFSNRRASSARADSPGASPGGPTATNDRGYCYLALFEALNAVSSKKLDIAAIKARLRAFPLVRRVVAELYAYVTFDLFLPCVRRVSGTMFHVDVFQPPMRFSEVVSMTMFSNARIGADDRAFLRQQQLVKMQDLCKTAGLDRNVILADAAKKCLSRALTAPDSELNLVFEPILPRGKAGFNSPYHLDVQQLATLQADYPELGVTGGGSIHHPHAYAAVATLCQEAVILRRMNYDVSTVVPRGYDAVVVDVGANYPRHAKSGRFNIHGCCPVLTARDSSRDTTRALVMSTLVSAGKMTADTARKYCEPDAYPGRKLLRCKQRAENCQIKAQFMMFIHSQYDITLEQLGAIFDAHGTVKAYSVMNFVPDIFVSSQGTVSSLGLNYHKEGDTVVFSFVGDASMNYRHDLQSLLRTYSAQHLITPAGVMYVCERVVRGGALFLEYTRCTIAPERQEEYFDFNFWDAAADDIVFLTTWSYDHTRYAGSKFVKGPTGFRRLIIGVDKAFYERLYMHCLRSGDASFNVNQVVSAASTFNTKMSINGANIRAVNRVGVDVFFDAVIAIYMIAYRTRWMGTKTLHHMIESEKEVRSSYKLGFAGAFRALWNLVTAKTSSVSLVQSLVDMWNDFVDKCSTLNSAGDLDVELLNAVRTVRFSEFLQYNAKYEGKHPELHDIHVDSVTFDCDKGMLREVVNVVRSKYAGLAQAPATGNAPSDSTNDSGPRNPNTTGRSGPSKHDNPAPTKTQSAAPRVFGAPLAPMSNKQRNSVITEFHRTQSAKSETNSARLRAGRHEAYTCTSVLVQKSTPPDGNCVFTTLGYFVGLTANEMRADLCGAAGVTALRYNDKTVATWGTTDCVTTYSSLYGKRVCLHMTVTKAGKQMPTVTSEMYSSCDSGELVHLDWRVHGNPETGENYSAHVEVLTNPADARDFPREAVAWSDVAAKFACVRRLPHATTDEYNGFAKHQELKCLSLLETAKLVDVRPTKLLELGAAPGTWTRLLTGYTLSVRAQFDVVSDPEGLAFDPELLDEVAGCKAVTIHEQDALVFLQGNTTKYDFVISDVAGAESWSSNAPQLDVLCAVVSCLNLNATLVLKLSNVFLENCVDAIASCRRLFAGVQLVKPAGSRMRNTEVYLVCEKYGGIAQQLNPYKQRRDIIISILSQVERLNSGERVRVDVADEHARLSYEFLAATQQVSMEWDDEQTVVEDQDDESLPPLPPQTDPRRLYQLAFIPETPNSTLNDPAPEQPSAVDHADRTSGQTVPSGESSSLSNTQPAATSEVVGKSDGLSETVIVLQPPSVSTAPVQAETAREHDTSPAESKASLPPATAVPKSDPVRAHAASRSKDRTIIRSIVVTPSVRKPSVPTSNVLPLPAPTNNCHLTTSSALSSEGSTIDAVQVKPVDAPPTHSAAFLEENGLVMTLDDSVFDSQHPWQCVAHYIRTNHAGCGVYERIMELGVYTKRIHYEYDELISAFGPCTSDYSLPDPLNEFLDPTAATVLTKTHCLTRLEEGKTVVVKVSDPAVPPLVADGWRMQVHRCRTTPPNDMSVYYVYTQAAQRRITGSWKQVMAQVINSAVKGVEPYDPSLLRAVLRTTKAGGLLDDLEGVDKCETHETTDDNCLCCVYVATGHVRAPMVASWLRRKFVSVVNRAKERALLSGVAEILALNEGVPVYMRDDRKRAAGTGLVVDGSAVACASYKPNSTQKAMPSSVGGQTQRASAPGFHKIDVGGDQVAHVATYGSVSKQSVTFHGRSGPTKAAVVDARGKHKTLTSVSGVVSDVHSTVTYQQQRPLVERTVRDVAINATDAKFGCVSVHASVPRYANFAILRNLVSYSSAATQTDSEYIGFHPCTSKPVSSSALPLVPEVDSSSESDATTQFEAADRLGDTYATSTTSTPTGLSRISSTGPQAFTAKWKAEYEAAMAARRQQVSSSVSSAPSSFNPMATSSTKSVPTGSASEHSNSTQTDEQSSAVHDVSGTQSNQSSSLFVSTGVKTPVSTSVASSTTAMSSAAKSEGNASTDALLPVQKFSKLQACKSMLKAAIGSTKVPPTQNTPASEVYSLLPRGSRDTLAVGGIWTAQPNDCKIVLHIVEFRGKAFALTDGLTRRLKKDKVTASELQKCGFVSLRHTLELYHRCNEYHEFLLVATKLGTEETLKQFLMWLPDDVVRVAVETVLDLADTALVDVLRECARPVALVDGRTRKWAGVLHLINPSKHLLPKRSKPLAFPKCTQREMGYIDNPPLLSAATNLDKYRNAMIEFRYLTAHADNFNKAHFKSLPVDAKNGIPAGKTAEILAAGYGVYDQTAKAFLGQPVQRKYSHGYSVSLKEYVPWNETAQQFTSTDRYIIVGRNTELMLNVQISEQIAKVDVQTQQMPEIEWINGPPGCGKTYEIVHSAHVSSDPLVGRDLILCMTREGKTSIQAGLQKLHPNIAERALRTHVRTVASLLVNGSEVKYDHVWMDEALMAHAGTIGYVAALTGTKKVSIIGDIHQIPYVDREHMCDVKYETPATFADITAVREITHRCPLDVTWALSDKYQNLCSTSTVAISVSQSPYSANITRIPKCTDNCLYLTHTQADKDALVRNGYGKGKGSAVMTVHEAQGQTFHHVVCIRSQPKALAIFSASEYAIVAISRHTQSFKYYTDVDDALTKLIKKAQAKDPAALLAWNAPRLVAAQKKLKPLAAGGLLSEGEVVLVPISNETTGHYTAGLPEVSHSPLMPCMPERVADSTYRKLPKVRPNVDNDVAYLQTFYDDIMGEAATVDYKYDQVMMELEDTSVASTPIVVDPMMGIPYDRKFGKLRPLLRTNMRAEKQPSQKESILGAVKRNLNAPVLRNIMLSEEAIGELLYKNFERSAIDPVKQHIYETYADDPIGINSQVVSAWLEKQPPARRKQIIVDLPLHLRPFNKFEFMVKKDVKPQLTPDSMYAYPSVQTIVYNDASVNAVSCPIYNLLWERLLAVLDPRVLVMTGMSPKEFENEFNARLSPEVACVLRTVENDFSKYDKAQAGALRRLEHLVWTKLGLDPEIALIWDRSRRDSDVRDRKNGVSFTTQYQRKSGEATTFSGNTLVAICVMLAVIDIDDIVLMLAAGDDTAIYLKPGVEFSDSSALVADLFNLECKLLECYEVPYFCSKFLISTPDWTYFVHDLLKFVTKLGRHDMSNYTHVENYRVSCVDTMSSLFNPVVASGLTAGLRERYHCTLVDVTKVLAVLRTLCHDPCKFAALYLLDRGVILCDDPSASKLR